MNTGSTATYEIYPIPQQVIYGEGTLSLDQEFQVIYDEAIDSVTKHRLAQVFKGSGFSKPEEVETPSAEKTTIHVKIEDAEEIDAYTLKIESDTITITGKDTDAAFHGITTLGHILKQSTDNSLQTVEINDYSETTIRGFIEGFYGIPWSNEDRKELMRFGGDFKMNAYIFAPKDDPYHNEKWRDLYPEKEIQEIAYLVAVGNETKNQFIWTIHPFMRSGVRFDGDTYAKDLNTIITKFEQLYEIGVRQFGVLADDVDLASMNPENQKQLLEDLYEWNQQQEGTYNLIFVPSIYNYEWAPPHMSYYEVMNQLPEDIHVMWTGNEVMGTIDQETIEDFQSLMPGDDERPARNPFFWLNWPVNDNHQLRLTVGKSEVLEAGVTNLDGVVTNPMQQAEASKGAIFTLADYTWNTSGFDLDQNYEASFKYIEPATPASLRIIADHLNDQSPNYQRTSYEESGDIKELLNTYTEALAEETVTVEQTDEVIAAFEKIAAATKDFKESGANKRYLAEVISWVNSLEDIANGTIAYLEAKKADLNEDTDLFAEKMAAGDTLRESAKHYTVENIRGTEEVEAGTKRLVPFMETLRKDLTPPVMDFEVSKNIVQVNEAIEIENLSGLKAENISWEFPGAVQEEDKLVISYPKEGRYTIRMKGETDKGSDEMVKEDYITVSGIAKEDSTNLALNKATEVSGFAAESESGARAVDGDLKSKWVDHEAKDAYYLTIDLGQESLLSTIEVYHAESGGEPESVNTKDFTVQLSQDGRDFKTIADVTDNTQGKTVHKFPATHARYVKLVITQPTQGYNKVARICEVKVLGYEGSHELPVSYKE